MTKRRIAVRWVDCPTTMLTLSPARTVPATGSGAIRRADAGTKSAGFYRYDLDGLRGIAISFLALVFGFALLFRKLLRSYTRIALIVLLAALTIASFVYAIVAHDADQSTAYYNSFARGWELLLGALVGALVPYVKWPMWLRTTVAVVALAAILSCGALIDGVKEFPGPWALVPVGATMLFILSAANRQSDPGTADRLPAP